MGRQNRGQHARRFAPRFEGLEVRELLSTSALIASTSLLATTRGATSAAGSVDGLSTSNPIPLIFRPFIAKFQGPIVVGPPRATGQISQTYMFGGGNSSAFLHGDLQLGLFTPADPSQPIIGQATLTVKNVSNTGNQLIVDLTSVPAAVDRHGRPTLFTWTQNAASGGIFTNGDGSGTMQLIYSPGRFPGQSHLHQIRTAGNVGVIFRGTLGTTNLNSTIRNQ
jgi:hypothetical protein